MIFQQKEESFMMQRKGNSKGTKATDQKTNDVIPWDG